MLVIPPPASAPQENVPFDQRSLSPGFPHDVSPAPVKSEVKRFEVVAFVTIADPADKALTDADDAKKFVDVLVILVRDVIVVVASVVVPVAVKLPRTVVEARSERNDVFSSHDVPFQKSVLPGVVPDAIAVLPPLPPVIVIHFVLVPVVEST
jgi:hypothetical protein